MAGNTLLAAFGLLAAVATVPAATDAFRVLGIFPFPSRSHSVMSKATLQALVDSGHEVVELNPFPLKPPRPNYTDVDLSKDLPSYANAMKFEDMTEMSKIRYFYRHWEKTGDGLCRQVFQTKQFQDIMNGVYGKFDVVFTEICSTDCWAVVAHKLQLPLISLATQPDLPHISERVGSVDNPSYIPTSFEPLAGRMNLWERCRNVVAHLTNIVLAKWYYEYPSDPVVRELFGADTPPIAEMIQNTSLVMISRHVSVNPARPVNPNVIDVAGIHVRDKPSVTNIPAEIRKWMDESEHGVVFLSLGSLVRSDSLPRAHIEALRAAFTERKNYMFAALPQRVLWKFENDTGIEMPANVKVASWLPQSDILAHPKVVVFMTHGGLMGSTEALMLGVPMIGMPLFGDQWPNVRRYEALGIARQLDYRHLTKESALATIRAFTTSNKYQKRAQEVAALFADRPRSPAQEAVWWTEYVVRHKGARHLRPLGADMPLYQYLLLDVLAVLLAAAASVLLAAFTILRKLFASSKQPSRRKAKTQ